MPVSPGERIDTEEGREQQKRPNYHQSLGPAPEEGEKEDKDQHDEADARYGLHYLEERQWNGLSLFNYRDDEELTFFGSYPQYIRDCENIPVNTGYSLQSGVNHWNRLLVFLNEFQFYFFYLLEVCFSSIGVLFSSIYRTVRNEVLARAEGPRWLRWMLAAVLFFPALALNILGQGFFAGANAFHYISDGLTGLSELFQWDTGFQSPLKKMAKAACRLALLIGAIVLAIYFPPTGLALFLAPAVLLPIVQFGNVFLKETWNLIWGPSLREKLKTKIFNEGMFGFFRQSCCGPKKKNSFSWQMHYRAEMLPGSPSPSPSPPWKTGRSHSAPNPHTHFSQKGHSNNPHLNVQGPQSAKNNGVFPRR